MWLVGMMGSGKTTVGRAVAEVLGVPFYDTDAMVEEKAGRPITAIWRDIGEEGFRSLEREAVGEVPEGDLVAAAGGGAVTDPVNRLVIGGSKTVVWLRCEPEELARRLAGTGERPLLGEGDLSETLSMISDRRAGHYAAVATHTVDTEGRSIDSVVEEVLALWRG